MLGKPVCLGVWGTVLLSALTPFCCVTLGKSLPLSELSLHLCQIKWGGRDAGGVLAVLPAGRREPLEGNSVIGPNVQEHSGHARRPSASPALTHVLLGTAL